MDDASEERSLNRVEVLLSLIYATLWALFPTAEAARAQRYGGVSWFRLAFVTDFVPVPVAVFLTTFVIALILHLWVASRRP